GSGSGKGIEGVPVAAVAGAVVPRVVVVGVEVPRHGGSDAPRVGGPVAVLLLLPLASHAIPSKYQPYCHASTSAARLAVPVARPWVGAVETFYVVLTARHRRCRAGWTNPARGRSPHRIPRARTTCTRQR